ncbi:MAG: DUF3516 domain-containing protein [Atopobiaceae bacterium]|nr:DUF3516 domain-containing protein [Atopobiaceae bacterium]
MPWPDDEHYPNISPDDALELFLNWCEQAGYELWPHQEEALLSLAAGEHLVLGTPTGSGKSLVALGACFMSVCTNRRAYYTAPIKALVSEKFFEMVRLFGNDNVGMLTGDVVINSAAPIICCTAEILAQDALRQGNEIDCGCAVMDEFHYYGDADRGWAWQVPLITLNKVQFVLMSATLGDMSSITSELEKRTQRSVADVSDAPRPVPLSFEFAISALEATVERLLEREDAPIYIVHFAQEAAFKSASALVSYGVSTKEQRQSIKEALIGVSFSTAFGKSLKRLLLGGVGVHHAGMLPRYRLLVEKLAQQGLLPVICGTDTLGVGINVPIHTVLLTALAKFDGHRQRRLNAREFHQIAGRAGRSGFDTEGLVVAQATEFDIDAARALAKAGGDAKAAKKIRTKKPPEGFVGWNEQTFDRLVAASPEALKSRMKITHAMVLAEVMQGGDAHARTHALIDDAGVEPSVSLRLHTRADEIFATLMDSGVIECRSTPEGELWAPTIDIPEDFALDQPLSPFMLAALELLDRESDSYAYELISMVEATLDDPYQILRAQERMARDQAMQEMKADGIDYDERMERIREVSYPKPLEELLEGAYERYCNEVPWARDFAPHPKSVLRDMIESASDFKGYIQRCGIARSEGLLLRYLSDAYRVLSRTVPAEYYDEQLEQIVGWLVLVVRGTDSSLIDEWEGGSGSANDASSALAPPEAQSLVKDRKALVLLVRNALFARVKLAAARNAEDLGLLDEDWGWKQQRWQAVLDSYFDEHEEILIDADARSWDYLSIDETSEADGIWNVRQVFKDESDDRDFSIVAELDLLATQDQGSAVFTSYRVGFFEDLATGND